LRAGLVLNPLLSGVTWFRLGFFPRFPTHSFSLGYLVAWAVVSLIIGLALEFWLGDRIKEQ
jgi:capsular polysaccharide transport system permease protein